ncbi:MAG: hypothetical protein LBU53_02765 [Zoogloeaceae bacterium]|jgi:acetyltransferase-like isoleucine patch superfamily enzyme|nr:hypothetical protein [Zoogloeaceae bacterium]
MNAPCAAKTKLRDWLAAGAKERLTLVRDDFACGEFALTDLLFHSGSLTERLRQYWRSFCAYTGSFTPFSGWKIFWYRRAGMQIGKNVFISPGVSLDLLFPQLITLENNVVLGLEAIIVAHIYTPEKIVVARATVGAQGLVGGRGILAATHIGEKGVLGANSYTVKPVPAGYIALGVPAAMHKRKAATAKTPGEQND